MGIKTKIKSIEDKTFQGKVTGHILVLENGIQGYLSDKGSDLGLMAGSDVEYTLEVKKNKKTGADYNLLTVKFASQSVTPDSSAQGIKPAKEESEIFLPSTKGTTRAKSIAEMKYEGRVYCLKLAVKCLLAKAIEYPQVKQYFTEWVELLDASIDEIKG